MAQEPNSDQDPAQAETPTSQASGSPARRGPNLTPVILFAVVAGLVGGFGGSYWYRLQNPVPVQQLQKQAAESGQTQVAVIDISAFIQRMKDKGAQNSEIQETVRNARRYVNRLTEEGYVVLSGDAVLGVPPDRHISVDQVREKFTPDEPSADQPSGSSLPSID